MVEVLEAQLRDMTQQRDKARRDLQSLSTDMTTQVQALQQALRESERESEGLRREGQEREREKEALRRRVEEGEEQRRQAEAFKDDVMGVVQQLHHDKRYHTHIHAHADINRGGEEGGSGNESLCVFGGLDRYFFMDLVLEALPSCAT
jgi:chromosome segregation ATPase